MNDEQSEKIVADAKVFDMSMTSRQIADLTEKRHADVIRDIKKTIERGDIAERNFALGDYLDGNSQKRPEYILDFDATMLLITGYDGSRRKAVITRWRELEQGNAKLVVLTDSVLEKTISEI